jgi:hypothetical protein
VARVSVGSALDAANRFRPMSPADVEAQIANADPSDALVT